VLPYGSASAFNLMEEASRQVVVDTSRRALSGLAAILMGADVLLSSDDEDESARSRLGSYPRVRATFEHATRYLSDLEFTRAFRMSPDCFGKLL
jgi:hypothetical protein